MTRISKPERHTKAADPDKASCVAIDRRSLLQSAGAGAVLAGVGIWPGSAHAQAAPHFDLNIVMAPVDVATLPLRTYNKKTPGPTMVVDPGGSCLSA